MARPEEPRIAAFRIDCASHAEFYKVLEQEMKRSYLLSFFLTANHYKAGQGFAATTDQALKERGVFKNLRAHGLDEHMAKISDERI